MTGTAPPAPALTVGVNSYIDLGDANALAGNRLFASPWTNAEDATRMQALCTSTALLDRLRWQGRPVTRGQVLAWPRVPDRCPEGYPLAVTVPNEIITACFELALHLLSAGTLGGGPAVQQRMLGDAMTMYFAAIPDELPKHVRRLIEPHLRASSANVAEVLL